MKKSEPSAKASKAAMTRSVAATSRAMLPTDPGMIRLWSDLATENARFLSQRLEEDLKAQAAMLACKTPAELAKLQFEFFNAAMTQYIEQAHCMFDIMTKASGEAGNRNATGTSRGYDDIPI